MRPFSGAPAPAPSLCGRLQLRLPELLLGAITSHFARRRAVSTTAVEAERDARPGKQLRSNDNPAQHESPMYGYLHK